MAEGLGMDSNLFETYHQRMAEIQDVSDVIAVANMQLNKILSQFGWSRQSLLKKDELETCPIVDNHKVHKDNLQSHIQTCTLRKHNILSVKKKDLSLPPYYDSQSAVVPVFVSKAQYKKVGVKIDEDASDESNSMVDDVLEVDDDINDYKPYNSLDELRFIYSWHKIPRNYIILDITRIPQVELSNWLIENISAIDLSSHLKQCLVNSMLAWLNELPTPSQIMSYIQDLLGKNSKSFVLRLWKYLAAKCLCLNQQIPEHTRNEFDFYTTTSMTNQVSSVSNEGFMEKKITIENVNPPLHFQWVFSNMSSEQKLAIYEDVCKTWRFLKKPIFDIDTLKQETQEQVKMLTDFDENAKGMKTHWEVLAELRDYKRRRQSYRGKNKSKRMSGLDVLRELLNQQMLYLKLIHENKRQLESEKTRSIEAPVSRSVSPEDQTRRRSGAELEDSDRHRSLNRGRDSKRNRSRSREKNSRSWDVRSRSRSRSRNRHYRSKRPAYRERSRERDRYRDSREKTRDEISNKSYY